MTRVSVAEDGLKKDTVEKGDVRLLLVINLRPFYLDGPAATLQQLAGAVSGRHMLE